jgi:threonine/homoserine/homoserine lactone efflux protein
MLFATAVLTSLAAADAKAPTIAPAFVIALFFAAIFFVLGFVVFSYKNVANRQMPQNAPRRPASPVDEFGHAEEH